MQWDDLRYFLAVARSGQLAKGAATLAVDATTVGRRIRRLEQAVGQVLFEQTREGHVLTEAGEQLLLKAEAVERRMAEIDVGVAEQQSISGLVRVSVSEGFGTWFVAHLLPRFLDAFPEVRVDLVASSGFLSPSKRETDVAVLLARPRRGPLISKKLSDYRLGVYASRAFLSRHDQEPGSAAELSEYPLVGYIPDLIYAPELRYLDEIESGLSPRVRSSSINAQYRLIAAGAGIGVLPCFIGDADRTLVRLLPRVAITRSFWLATHQDTHRLARIQAFVGWIEETLASRRSTLLGSRGPEPRDFAVSE